MTTVEICDVLRRQIVADLHLGKIKPGGRLPSLRIVARELGVSIRAAARAYAELQREGLVSVRGRSGIYLVLPVAVEADLAAPFDWYAEMLKEAWSRRLSLAEVASQLQRLVDQPPRAACVESTEDHMVAFCAELENDFALETRSILLTPEGAQTGGATRTLYDALCDVDFVVTTAFHASEVREAAELLQKPVVVVSVNETVVETIEQRLREAPVMIVGEDPAFVERFRTYLIEGMRWDGELSVHSRAEYLARGASANGSTTLFTRAARRQMNEQEYHLLPPPVPFLSVHAVRRIVQCMLHAAGRRALGAGQAGSVPMATNSPSSVST